VTVVPAFTVSVPGVNVKLTIFIVLLEAAVVVLPWAVVLDVEQLAPPNISTDVRIAMIVNNRYFFILSPLKLFLHGYFDIHYLSGSLNLKVMFLPGIIYVKIGNLEVSYTMNEKTIIIINLILQCALFVSLLTAGFLARFRHKLKLHCLVMRIAIPVQIASIAAIMLPAMLGYIQQGNRTPLFNTAMLIHHTLGLVVVALTLCFREYLKAGIN
jgi:hypothetical protein